MCLPCRLAYDGRGNYVVRSEQDLAAGAEALGGFSHGLYVEKWMPFVKELAVMVVRSRDGRWAGALYTNRDIGQATFCSTVQGSSGLSQHPCHLRSRMASITCGHGADSCLKGSCVFTMKHSPC